MSYADSTWVSPRIPEPSTCRRLLVKKVCRIQAIVRRFERTGITLTEVADLWAAS